MAAREEVVDNQEDDSGKKKDKDYAVKIICLGDSAVGKSKLVERFLMDGYKPQQLSTYALTLFQYRTHVEDKDVRVDFWDTAGQERFSSMHPSYYHQAHSCILVFDITRKITYKNLATWYKELREYREQIPCIVVANKIDVDYKVTQKCFNFPKKHGLPFFFVSASDGTNVVKPVDYKVTQKCFNFPKKHGLPFFFVSASDGTNVVKVFREAIKLGVRYKENSTDFMDEVLKELENFDDLSLNQDSEFDKKSEEEEETY